MCGGATHFEGRGRRSPRRELEQPACGVDDADGVRCDLHEEAVRLCPAQVDGVSIAAKALRKSFIGVGSAGVWDVRTAMKTRHKNKMTEQTKFRLLVQ